MSDPRTDRDMDETLAAWMDQVAPKRAPTRLLEETFAETMRAGQVRAYPWHRGAPGSPGRTVARSGARTGLIVFAALLLLVVAAVGIGGGGLRLVAPPISSAPPTPGATLTPGPTPGATVSPSAPAAIAVVPEAVIPVQSPMAMVTDGHAIWVMAPGRLDRIDPGANAVTGSAALGSASDLYNGLAANAAGLWATSSNPSILYRVDPVKLKVTARIPAGLSAKGVLATADGVWVADVHGGSVLRIDPATNKPSGRITVGPSGTSGPNWLADGLGSIWVDVPNNGTVVRFDPVTNDVQATIGTPAGVLSCGGIAVGSSAVWVTSCSAAFTMARIDPASNTVVAAVDLGGYGYNPTLIDGVPWVSVDTGSGDTGMLVRIDPATSSIDRVLVPGGRFGGGGDIVVADGSVWVVREISRAAQEGLAGIPGREADAAALNFLKNPEAKHRLIGIDLVGRRRMVVALPGLLAAANDPDPKVRASALQRVGKLGASAEVPALIKILLRSTTAQDLDGSAAALTDICIRTGASASATAQITNALASATPGQKGALLGVLGALGGDKALAAVRAALKVPNPEVHVAAVRALTAWPDLAAAPDLLQVVRLTTNSAERNLAFLGFVRLISESGATPDEKLKRLTEATSLASSSQEKMLVLAGLGDIPSGASLRLVTPYLSDPEVVEEAGAVAVRITEKLDPKFSEEIGVALNRVLKSAKSPQVLDSARKRMEQLKLPIQP